MNNVPFSGDVTGAAAIFAGAAPVGDQSTVAERLNALLRSEIRISENYAGWLKESSLGRITEILKENYDQHIRQRELLSRRVVELGGEPEISSGTHGIVSHAIHETISFVGGEMAGIRGLLESEKSILGEYTASVEEVDQATASWIANQLLPSQQNHVAVLEEILNTKK